MPMIRALVIKELRETGWIAAIGLAAYLYNVAMIVSPSVEQSQAMLAALSVPSVSGASVANDRLFPFVHGNFVTNYTIISLMLAVALGLRQTVGEARGGTFNFLLQRPMTRRTMFLTKTAVGVGLFLTVAALPVLALALWAATPGTHPSPFEWSMTVPVWKVWIAMPIAYLGAFLCGIRPARWFGTRLVPLAAVTLPIMLVASAPWLLLLCLPMLVLTIGLLLTGTFWVEVTRDYS
jgi:hypothetical protein